LAIWYNPLEVAMCEGMACGAMMWGGWLVGILAIVVLGSIGPCEVPEVEVSPFSISTG
jgi:hypothetical protein